MSFCAYFVQYFMFSARLLTQKFSWGHIFYTFPYLLAWIFALFYLIYNWFLLGTFLNSYWILALCFPLGTNSYLWEEWKERHPDSPIDYSEKFLNLRFVSLEVCIFFPLCCTLENQFVWQFVVLVIVVMKILTIWFCILIQIFFCFFPWFSTGMH